MSVLAISGSINCVKHLQAVAREAGTDVDVYGLFESYADMIRPLLARFGPTARTPSRSSRTPAARSPY